MIPLLLLACSGSSELAPTSTTSASFTLAYSGAVDGEIEPCG